MRAVKLCAALVVILCLGWTPARAGDRWQVQTYVMKNSAGGSVLDGGPEDSLAAGATITTDSIYVFGAKKIIYLVRDSSTTETAYSDSLSAALIQYSWTAGATNWHSYGASSVAAANNDTIAVMGHGKLSNQPLSFNDAVAGNRTGYNTFTAVASGYSTSNADGVSFQIPWTRLVLTNQTRKRSAAVTGNAAILGLRVVVFVIYDGEPVALQNKYILN